MRYWIWWNDLTQGPFELEELTSLKAFSEDLLVCMEDREDWLPASRIADLSSAIEQLRARRAAPRMPPPPPPKRPPSVTPLQGEFFADPPGQQPLLETDDSPKGPFAYRSALDEPSRTPWGHLEGRVTMPFHFVHQPDTSVAVIELPRPEPRRVAVESPPIITESAVPKEEPIAAVPLKLLQEEPTPTPFPSLDFPIGDEDVERKRTLLPWIIGVLLAMSTLGGLSYWLVGRASPHGSRSSSEVGTAVSRGNRVEPATSNPASENAGSNETAPAVSNSPAMSPPSGGHAATAPEKTTSIFSSLLKHLQALLPGGANPTSGETTNALPNVAGNPTSANGGAVSPSPNRPFFLSTVLNQLRAWIPGVHRAGANPVSSDSVLPGSATSNAAANSSEAAAPGSAASRVPANATVPTPSSFAAGSSLPTPAKSQSFFSSVLDRLHNLFPGVGNSANNSPRVVSPMSGQGAELPQQKMAGSQSVVPDEEPLVAVSNPVAGSSPENVSRSAESSRGLPRGQVNPSNSEAGSPSAKTKLTSALSSLVSYIRALLFGAASNAGGVASSASTVAPQASALQAGQAAAASATGSIAGNSLGFASVPAKVVQYAAAKSKTAAARAAAAARKKFAGHALSHKKPVRIAKTPPSAEGALSGESPEPGEGSGPGEQPVSGDVIPALPGLAPAASASAVPKAGTAFATPSVHRVQDATQNQTSANNTSESPNPWKGKEKEAIALVQNKTLPHSKITVGSQVRSMLQEMHEKELIHAAETGERLYLPDKMAWAALDEEGPRYRVYLNFLAMQANGERIQTRSYQFIVDLQKKDVRPDDAATQQDLLGQPVELTFKHNPMASDIDSILGGVDTYNKHKVQLIIVKKNSRNRDDRKKIEAALATSQAKITRAIVYFRRTYTEQALQNIAKAYLFTALLKG